MGALRRRGERGSTIVEAAVVLPAVIAMLFGMLETGLYFKDSLTLSDGVKNGARTGAEYAQAAGADYYIIQSVLTAGSIDGAVQEIVIYDAADPNSANPSAQNPSSGCQGSTSGGVQLTYTDSGGVKHVAIGSCNVYLAANGDFSHQLSEFVNGTFTNSTNWPGSQRLQNTTDTRYTQSGTASSGPDYIGVWVKTTHNWLTGFVSTKPTTITDQAVFRIEPRQ
jgi:hypothetical protein